LLILHYLLPPTTDTLLQSPPLSPAVNSWQKHVPRSQDANEVDFVTSNREAAIARCTTPVEFNNYRQEHDIRVGVAKKRMQHAAQRSAASTPLETPKGGYGVPPQPKHTDGCMKDIMSMAYQRQWLAESTAAAKARLIKQRPKSPAATRASMAHAAAAKAKIAKAAAKPHKVAPASKSKYAHVRPRVPMPGVKH
jgi:Cilia- and flagella-associated protein 77